jgi:hypothetical protein
MLLSLRNKALYGIAESRGHRESQDDYATSKVTRQQISTKCRSRNLRARNVHWDQCPIRKGRAGQGPARPECYGARIYDFFKALTVCPAESWGAVS